METIINPTMLSAIRTELAASGYGHKSGILAKYSAMFKYSTAQIYRAIKSLNPHNNKTRKSEPLKPEYREWAGIVFLIKKRPPEEAGEISTDQAVEIAVKEGLIPPEAADVPKGTYDSLA
ncbi:MAG: hypothetical protein HQK98_06890 [Nitrospirae bacterium]|nr:hypothetical protein [Nitrospirota bacterium]